MVEVTADDWMNLFPSEVVVASVVVMASSEVEDSVVSSDDEVLDSLVEDALEDADDSTDDSEE